MKRSQLSLPRRACGALAALALALPLAAQAEVRGSIRLLDFGWSVVDLRPEDGVEAGVTFDPSFQSSLRANIGMRGVDANGDRLPYGAALSRSWTGNLPFANATRALELPGTQGSARMGGNAADGSYDFVVQGQGSRAIEQAGAFSGFGGGSAAIGGIVLAPFTGLVWTGRLSLSVEKTGSGPGMRHERVEASFGLHMENDDFIDWLDYRVELDTFGRAPGRQTYEDTFRLTFSNLNTFEAAADFELAMSLEGYSSMTPVPEPGAVGLMLAGVGVVGFVARRRKSLPHPEGGAG